MTDQQSTNARKAAAAEGAADNSGIGLDGDGAGAADAGTVSLPEQRDTSDHGEQETPDPADGRTGHAVGRDQAAENEEREPST